MRTKFLKKLTQFAKLLFIITFSFTMISATYLAINPLVVNAQAVDFTPPPKPQTEADDPQSINFIPQLSIPGSSFQAKSPIPVGTYNSNNGIMTSDLLTKYIKAFYNYGLSIAGILAAIVLMAGGVLWLTAAGNDTKISQAKELITGIITGVIILFCSWIILNTINPNLVNWQPITTQLIKKIDLVCCEYSDDSGAAKANMLDRETCKKLTNSTVKDALWSNGTWESWVLDVEAQKCVESGCCIEKDNGDGTFRCFDGLASQCPPDSRIDFLSSRCSKTAYADNCSIGVCELLDTENGDHCTEHGTWGWCYNSICWRKPGKEGEPCGRGDGSVCTTRVPGKYIVSYDSCSVGKEDNTAGSNLNDKRPCDSSLLCCSPEF